MHETGNRTFDIAWVREQFPSLKLQVNGQAAAFLDGPAGTQVPKQVMDAVQNYFLTANANTNGAFLTSRRTDEMILSARAAMADFFNCDRDEVVFGQNMTTITFALARAIGRELKSGDEIVVSTLDHDANVAPWRALEEKGVVIRQVDIRESDCTLDMEDLRHKLSAKTKLVAVGYASNIAGTINPVAEITKLAHAAGALMFVDAVHYAPHGLIDVQALDCDFLACSPYKFFGPHMGTLYGKRKHLEKFKPYKVRPATNTPPESWETGTQVQELIAGIGAAVDYLAELGRHSDAGVKSRRAALQAAYRATHQYESGLLTRLISGLPAIPGMRIFGITDRQRFEERCSTLSFRLGDHHPTKIAAFLGQRGIFTWDGNFYALNLSERLGVEQHGGVLRVGLVHYNTAEEVDRLLAALGEFSAG
ncbi:MAG: cysteine desulfurase-like protein [Acidobacteria bacterium]|nr:MAG: cysteine desulfurase-like protein [Acidobacteriota bacterium]PYU61342.1 MAG: cysteine desulfurase-like protein [Acidobacteriota bacterium]PYU62695.1 MAG: cysteine desulfurase-like protein [Acidobacteriota bacterium]PYU73577.1 MAG: cysteine desulfurase-like protein [Acidobacteriota bacterium]